MECFKPTGILELGAGKKSTPIFYGYGKKLISIETDKKWFLMIKEMLEPRTGFEILYHDVGHGICRKSLNLSKEVIDRCILFYDNVLDKHTELDLLFIDHISGLRAPVLIRLFNRFDFILYHDAQHSGYRYGKFDMVDSSGYRHLMFRSFKVWTGVLIHKKHEDKIDEFNALLLKYGTEYCDVLGILYKHTVKF